MSDSEKRAHQCEELLSCFFDDTSDAILLLDSTGAIVDANPAACELLGRPREELDEHPLMSFVRSESNLATIWTGLAAGDRESGEFELERPDGTLQKARWRLVVDAVPWISVLFLRAGRRSVRPSSGSSAAS
jgi:PAS domain S-box-containing protein